MFTLRRTWGGWAENRCYKREETGLRKINITELF